MTETIGPVLAEYRKVLDAIEDLKDQTKRLNEQREKLKRKILNHAEQHELTVVADDGLTCTVAVKCRAAYEPDKWDSIVRWAVENDATYIVQRRLSDKKIDDLVTSGTVLPDGLRLEPYTDLVVRRK